MEYEGEGGGILLGVEGVVVVVVDAVVGREASCDDSSV